MQVCDDDCSTLYCVMATASVTALYCLVLLLCDGGGDNDSDIDSDNDNDNDSDSDSDSDSDCLTAAYCSMLQQ